MKNHSIVIILLVLVSCAVANTGTSSVGDTTMKPGKSIDARKFLASGPVVELIAKDSVVNAPLKTVYRAWTDGDAFHSAYAPDREEFRANIDLTIGGRYEILWDGEIGSNGCQVLSYVPDEQISVSWNAPPTQPESRAAHTWVVVSFEQITPKQTLVKMRHIGFGRNEHWRETQEYFDGAWDYLLGQFEINLDGAD